MADWDAARYHRLSDPQVGWGRRVVARLAAAPGERILDLGCGTGRLTAEIAGRPGIVVTGLDRSGAMLSQVRALSSSSGNGGHTTAYVRGEGVALPFAPGTFDAVFSTATFHWIPDHDRLFGEIHRVLKPGGRLVSQCGGGPNLQRLIERTHALMRDSRFSRWFPEWSDPWCFASESETEVRLGRAGFRDIKVSLEPAPTILPDARTFAEFISTACVRHHVDKLPAEERREFVAELAGRAAADDPPWTLDYWRLNIDARKHRA
jgi:trans-aconitate 2-methyltransferase